MTVQTNADKLVIVSVAGTIVHPSFPGLPAEPYRLAADGTPFLLPTYGGIVYNISVGDSAYGWLADCVHPGVSIHYGSELGNRGLNIYACVGNDAVVMTGEGKGTRGVVTGMVFTSRAVMRGCAPHAISTAYRLTGRPRMDPNALYLLDVTMPLCHLARPRRGQR